MDQYKSEQHKQENEAVVGRPERVSRKEGTSQTAEGYQAAGEDTLAIGQQYHTRVDLYIRSVGNDSGSKVELRGHLKVADQRKEIDWDIPIWSNFRDEGGKGRRLEWLQSWRDGVPHGFNASLYEDDTGKAQWMFKDYVMDFSKPANRQYADGDEWQVTGRNSAELSFEAILAWKVTPGLR